MVKIIILIGKGSLSFLPTGIKLVIENSVDASDLPIFLSPDGSLAEVSNSWMS